MARRWLGSARRALRWLLQVDLPAPARSEAEICAEVEHHYRWNFVVNLLDGAWFWFGYSFISAATIVPLFISKLTPNPLAVGLATALASGGWYLPQLLTTHAIERLPRKKAAVVNLGLFTERLPVWLLVPAALLASHSPLLALAIFFLGYAGFNLGAGLVGAAWQDLVARCFPVDRRGRFFGLTNFLGTAAGALGAFGSTYLLRHYPFPHHFVYLFTVGATSIALSWVFIALTREPVQPSTTPRQSYRSYWAGLPDLLRADRNFRRYLIARLLLGLGSMGFGFVTVAAVRIWQVPDGTVGLYTAVLQIGQTVGNLWFGFLADRRGHKLALEFSALASCLAFALAWLAPGAAWYFLVFALLGLAAGGLIVSGLMIILEFSGPERRPTYVGIANTSVGVVNLIAPLLGATLADLSFGWLFGTSAAANLAAFAAMRWGVEEPRWEQRRRSEEGR